MLSWKNEKQSLRINREKEREDGIYLFKRIADGQKDAEGVRGNRNRAHQ